tara:strand:+ start:556 stop:741 length:186 start_codon:yes stop_codon:yes gene_type:complete
MGNHRKSIINGKLGIVMETYTHTMNVYIPSTKKTMNIKRSLVKLLPKDEPKKKPINQLTLF